MKDKIDTIDAILSFLSEPYYEDGEKDKRVQVIEMANRKGKLLLTTDSISMLRESLVDIKHKYEG